MTGSAFSFALTEAQIRPSRFKRFLALSKEILEKLNDIYHDAPQESTAITIRE
jgi:hypothetical protein